MQLAANKQRDRMTVFAIICLGFYIFLKIYRNSLGGGTESQGGIWNVINLLFVGLAVICVVLNKWHIGDFRSPIGCAYAYSSIAFFWALVNLQELSVSSVFSVLMLFYFPSVMWVFSFFSEKGIGRNARMMITVLYYAVGVFCLYLMIERLGGRKEIYQSDMYFLLCLLPFVFLLKKRVGFYLPLLLCITVVFLSGKRTATLAVVGAILIFYFLQMKMQKNVKAFFRILLVLLALTLVVVLVYQFLATTFDLNLLERLENMAEDGGSGRDEIYIGILEAIAESNPIRWFIGYGVNAIKAVYGRNSSAHNDFLEIMYDFGILAVAAMLVFYVRMAFECHKMVKRGFPGAPAFAASLVISIFMSMFSNYLITVTHIGGMAAFWGVSLASWKRYCKTGIAEEAV